MNAAECQELIDSYLSWLRRGLSTELVGEACELTTPFLDRHNDHLQVYAQVRNGAILLSDDGYVISDLIQTGLEFTTPKRREALEVALKGFGVRLEDKNLVVEASKSNVGQRVHSLIQAMIAINDMYGMGQARVATFFWEDVKAYLDIHDVRYVDRVKIAGRTGFDHTIDFVIPRSVGRPERFIQTINTPTKSSVGSYLFSLTDTREARGADPEAYGFLNDEDQQVGGDVLEALESYEVVPALWTEREQYVERLAG